MNLIFYSNNLFLTYKVSPKYNTNNKQNDVIGTKTSKLINPLQRQSETMIFTRFLTLMFTSFIQLWFHHILIYSLSTYNLSEKMLIMTNIDYYYFFIKVITAGNFLYPGNFFIQFSIPYPFHNYISIHSINFDQVNVKVI